MSVRMEANAIRGLGRAIANGAGYDFPFNSGGPPFVGDGSGITNLNAYQLTTGTVPSARMPYKMYRVLLSQTGTDAPSPVVLENALGSDVVWTRDEAGVYTGTPGTPFVQDKTAFASFNGAIVWNGNPTIAFITTGFNGGSATVITSLLDLSVPSPNFVNADDIMARQFIEILVYP